MTGSSVWLLVNKIFGVSSGDHKQKFYWGHKEVLVPVYKNMADCMKKHPDAAVLVSFASLRSAYDSTVETMTFHQVSYRRGGISSLL